MAKTPVLNHVGQVIRWATDPELRRMEAAGQIRRGRKAVYLNEASQTPLMPTRTRISNGRAPGAAMGLSQVYTVSKRGHGVTGFKQIFPEDRGFFDCSGLPVRIQTA